MNRDQLSLRPDDRKVTVASACLSRLAQEYCEALESQATAGPLAREADEISYACLLLCAECADQMSMDDADIIEECRRCTSEHSSQGWLDCFIWHFAAEVLFGDDPYTGDMRSQLISDLDQPGSSIRCFMLESAWVVRNRLTADDAAPALLKNVADTLMGWDISLGICSSLFASKEEFWAYADAFSPPPAFDNQYRDRLAEVRLKGLSNCLVQLMDLELKVRRRIDAIALSLMTSPIDHLP
jgi:hypothetical protein